MPVLEGVSFSLDCNEIDNDNRSVRHPSHGAVMLFYGVGLCEGGGV